MRNFFQSICVAVFVGFGIVQMAATWVAMTDWLGFHWFVAGLVTVYLGWMPLIGSALGVLGAVNVWHWEWWQAGLLMFGQVLIMLVALILIFTGAALWDWLRSQRLKTKELHKQERAQELLKSPEERLSGPTDQKPSFKRLNLIEADEQETQIIVDLGNRRRSTKDQVQQTSTPQTEKPEQGSRFATLVDIERINTCASKQTIIGWFLGLAYYNWLSSSAEHVTLWGHVALVIGGMFVASIIIGGGVAILIALITRMATGNSDGSPHRYVWGVYISPVLAFFAAKYALHFAASF